MPCNLSTLPSDAALNETFATQPVVQVLDINDDLVTTDNQTIVTVVKSAGGAGNLTGATSLTVTNGVASFAGLEVTSAAPADAGTYTLSYDATNPSGYDFTALTDDVEISDDGMVGASLQFYVQPQSVAINEKIPNFQVKILDAGGHLCTACTDTITLGYYYGTGSLTDGGAGTMTRAAVEGVATCVLLAAAEKQS